MLAPPQLSVIQPWIKFAMEYLKYYPWLFSLILERIIGLR